MEATATVRPTAAELMTQNRGLILSILIVALPVVIVLKLPPLMMDFLLSFNLMLSIVILLTTIYVRRPLDFSVFPSLLLVTTLFRLVLNVATTRLILSNTQSGPAGARAAGSVIRAFGEFVAGANPLVGFIIFVIIVVVQFIVITKGATRISEVAARFTLDGMPGKQMAIDADLNAGLISQDEARTRRGQITQESDFYGAMDGASKYIRGDAIAGIVITIVNIVGGLIIGMLMHRMGFEEAVRMYTRLTVGDGLVTQIPAVIVSIAAGLIVTRSTAQTNLGEEMVNQVIAHPRALVIAAIFLVILGFTGLPWVPMTALAAGSLVVAGLVSREQHTRQEREARRERAEESQAPEPEGPQTLLVVDPMGIEVGYGLIRLVDPAQGGDLLERVAEIRRETARELGIVVPPIRVRDNMELGPNEYQVLVRGNRVAGGTALAGQFLAMDSGQTTGRVEGTETKEPVLGGPAVWVTPGNRDRAEALGYTVVDPATVLETHLKETIRRQADEILSRQDVAKLVESVKERAPALVTEVVPNQVSLGKLQKILQGLLRERVSIRNLEAILEALSECAGRTQDVEVLTECARNSLARTICQGLVDETGVLHVVTLDPTLEETIQAATERREGVSRLTLKAQTTQRIVRAIAGECGKLTAVGHAAVVLCSPQVRATVRQMIESTLPQVSVVGYNEIVKDVQIESLGMVVIE